MTAETGSAFDRQLARIAVGAYDDAQDVRTAMMNRVRDVIRKRNEDIAFDVVEEEKDPEEQDFEKAYKDGNLPDLIEEMKEEGKLTHHEFNYLQQMLEAASAAQEVEERYKDMMSIVTREPIYQQWLDNVYGVSTTLAARLLHKFGYCEKFPRVSNLWSYSGLAPGQTRVRGEQLNYDPEAKTLAWLIADTMIKQGENSMYRVNFYDPYKEKQVSRMERSVCQYCGKRTDEHVSHDGDKFCTDEHSQEVTLDDFGIRGKEVPDGATPPWTQGHADNRARRYLGKKFLKHYWAISRDIIGASTPDEWVLTHGGHEKETDTFENPFYAKRKLMDPDD